MTNNELHLMKEYSEYIYNQSLKLIKERQSLIVAGLYSETKLKDEKELSYEKPNDYYIFRYLNVYIYIYYQKSSKKYTVCCENWQPKPQKETKDIKVFRGKYSLGQKDTLEQALILYQQLVHEFITQKFRESEVLF